MSSPHILVVWSVDGGRTECRHYAQEDLTKARKFAESQSRDCSYVAVFSARAVAVWGSAGLPDCDAPPPPAESEYLSAMEDRRVRRMQ